MAPLTRRNSIKYIASTMFLTSGCIHKDGKEGEGGKVEIVINNATKMPQDIRVELLDRSGERVYNQRISLDGGKQFESKPILPGSEVGEFCASCEGYEDLCVEYKPNLSDKMCSSPDIRIEIKEDVLEESYSCV